ncbi:ankyrin repeat domain-containing protein [Leptospira borgpetersenii]|uniref:ankyrin repeat domain-containing protein n=1 Tax=Leptospira borgpetersenii TaxID=174 RepID=UPI00034C3AD9|nr:ankyrin repeat domain-containing protein [Leptospira borgpetersenii]URD70888.1 ankyrin repeat domain-containing protein [Leptospira borgpetersenii]UVD74066.1 ankyrin repeat domain-containing protein [Leptospira borgpetersenii]UVD77265.1 ankyrin repeat domain-containing protein [Leptospira borgpetersenii]UZW33827.1 ankyrin repeat domain-containing protein [Leptospira borgpetersenii]
MLSIHYFENLKTRFENFFLKRSLILLSIFIFLFSSETFGKSISKADRKILSAAISGNLRLAQNALNQGASIHAKDPRQFYLGETPLLKAVYNNDVSFVRFLLEKGADPNLPDDRGETPLITAVYGFSLESISVLLDAKADPYLETKSGVSPAVLAADLCSLPILKILKNAGVDFNRPTKKGFLPIYTATAKCNRKLLEFLIDSGSTIESPTANGITPLMHSIRYKNLDAIRLFMEKGVSVSSVDKHGRDALYHLLGFAEENVIAVTQNSNSSYTDKEIEEIAIYLIRKETPLYREYKDGRTALFLLLNLFPRFATDDVSDFFFQYRKKNQIDLNRPNRFGLTPFQYYKFSRKFKSKRDPNVLKNALLDLNSRNPNSAFYMLFLMDWEIDSITIDTILESFLSQHKLPVLEWLEKPLWDRVLFQKNPKLKKLLLNRVSEPPVSFDYSEIQSFNRLDKEEDQEGDGILPDDPENWKLWVRSIQRGKKMELNSYGNGNYYLFNANSTHKMYFAIKECRFDLLEKISPQPYFPSELTIQRGSSPYFDDVCTYEEEEEKIYKMYKMLQSIGENPGVEDWVLSSPLCSEIVTEFKDPKIQERSLRRISILLQIGANANCSDLDDSMTALDFARKYGLKHLEEILLFYGAQDSYKEPLLKAIVAKDKNEIQNLLDRGASIEFEELKSAKEDPEFLSYLLEEYNSFGPSPLFYEFEEPYYATNDKTTLESDLKFLQILLEKGFSLKVRSLPEHAHSYPGGGVAVTNCAINSILESDSKILMSLLKSQNLSDYSCRGFYKVYYQSWIFYPDEKKKMQEKIKKFKLDSFFPEFEEESYLFKPE